MIGMSMFKLITFYLTLNLFLLPNIPIVAQDKLPEESKTSEADKKAKEEKDKSEALVKEQEKKALENARNFFKLINVKKFSELKKLMSIPFIFDDKIIYTKRGVDEMFDEIEESVMPDNQVFQYSIDKLPGEYTDNNIVVILKDNNVDSGETICMWLDRDSQKIIGFFAKSEKSHINTEKEDSAEPKDDSVKKKSESKQKTKKMDNTEEEK